MKTKEISLEQLLEDFGSRTKPLSYIIATEKIAPGVLAVLQPRLKKVVHTLPPAPQGVLKLRYGLEDGVPKTLKQVAKLLNNSRERIRQVEINALRKMKF